MKEGASGALTTRASQSKNRKIFTLSERKLKLTLLISFQHKLRQREIIPLLRKLFGPYGMMEEKKSLWDFIRAKRSADSDGFPDVYNRMKEMVSTMD